MSNNPIERPMRRKDRELTRERAEKILEETLCGVLSCAGADGWPYGTPLSHVVLDGALYFHSATEGLRAGILRENPKVCYSVIAKNEPFYKGNGVFSTEYESAVAFGRAVLVHDGEERKRALLALCERHMPGYAHDACAAIESAGLSVAVWRIDIERLTGKANVR